MYPMSYVRIKPVTRRVPGLATIRAVINHDAISQKRQILHMYFNKKMYDTPALNSHWVVL